MNVDPTARAIEDAASVLDDYAADLRRIAERMRNENDLTLAAVALSAIRNCYSNLRIDLLVVRPLREFEKLEK